MASTVVPIAVAVTASATTLYTAFQTGGATTASLVSLSFCNTTASDQTIDVWQETGGGSTKYFAKTLTVPALGVVSLDKDMKTINAATDKWRAQASATGIDATGTVLENA